jgi:hypothetical protein
MLELNIRGLKYLILSATYPSCSKAYVTRNTNLFAHAASSVIDVSEANAYIDAGADVALLWIRPEFHSSEQIFSTSAQVSQFNQCSNNPIQKMSFRIYRTISEMFFQDVQAGLSPDRRIGHINSPESGAKPPFKPIYRLSPSEQEEAKRQISG